ncbi:MAG: cysteine peptidase family C39 domain-containing protein [Candidatus Nanopelagicales bacterium]|nr:cysteine peptidase family C39 domain-containing protein [Candidatus Nanopelagicales bacterium]
MSTSTAAASRRHREKTPARLQMEATECGAASLGIVLAHYGKWVPLEELRDACGISRDGSNALAVKIAAQKYGMEVMARRSQPETLKTRTLPAIVFWRFDHFLVVEGWSPDGWYLNDPALGHRTCSDEEFDESFTGIVLEMTPGPEFVRGGRPPRLVSRLASYLTGSRDGVLLIALLGLLLVIPQILVPGIARLFVDWLQGGPVVQVPSLLAALAFAALMQAALIGLQGAVGMRLATKLSVVLQSKLVARLFLLPANFHAMRGAGALAQRALQPARVAATVSTMFSTMVVGVISSSTAVALMVFAYPPAGAVAVAAVAFVVLAMASASRRRRTLAMRMVREQTEVATIAVTSLSQLEVIKASGAEDHLGARWTAAHNRFLAALQQLGERTVGIDLLPVFLITVADAAVTVVGLLGVTKGQLTLAGFVAVQTLLGLALAPAAMVVAQFQQAEMLSGELDQIDDVLQTKLPDIEVDASGEPRPAFVVGDLRLDGLVFGYDRNRPPLLTDLDLHIAPGSRVALVGPSGCGKSTVARLVIGLYQPWEGAVMVDGKPRQWWPEEVLHHDMAIVDQDPVIFAGTFRDNITLWDPTIDDAAVVQAVKDAALHDEIARRPGSYEAQLREGGGDLSGGQRQRLEIARALVRNPALLIMDEATSALDAATEAHIDAAIRRRGASSLIIAHRLSTVRDADEIIVLDKGQVVQRGRHVDLVAVDGPYRRLVMA